MVINSLIKTTKIRIKKAKSVLAASLDQEQKAFKHVSEIKEKMLELGVAPENVIAEIAKLNHTLAEHHNVPIT